jgi:hypothetical protein
VIDPQLAYTVGAGILGGGIAWGGIVTSVKGLKEASAEVKADLKKHTEADQKVQTDLLQSLARIEGALGINK